MVPPFRYVCTQPSSILRIAAFGLAPTELVTALPSRKTMRVGMLITRNCLASSSSSSTLTLPTLKPSFWAAPRRPEFQPDRAFGFEHLCLEIILGYRYDRHLTFLPS